MNEKEILIVQQDVKCAANKAYMCLDYRGQINRDCMGNIKEYLPRIVFAESYKGMDAVYNTKTNR